MGDTVRLTIDPVALFDSINSSECLTPCKIISLSGTLGKKLIRLRRSRWFKSGVIESIVVIGVVLSLPFGTCWIIYVFLVALATTKSRCGLVALHSVICDDSLIDVKLHRVGNRPDSKEDLYLLHCYY